MVQFTWIKMYFKSTIWCIFTNVHSCEITSPVKPENIAIIIEVSLCPLQSISTCHTPTTTSAGPPLIWFPWLWSNSPCPRTLYKWNHIAHVPLCLASCMLHDSFEIYSCCYVSVANHFYCWVVFHYINRPSLAYSFSCWWTFGLFPDPGAFQFIVWKMLM